MNYSLVQICSILDGFMMPNDSHVQITTIFYDSRLEISDKEALFVAFKTERRNGHSYIKSLYDKGFRNFMIDENIDYSLYPEAHFIFVKDVLEGYQKLAAYQRRLVEFPIIGITGSNGKTMVKEWVKQVLNTDYNVVYSPRSYNSRIGVAQSLLQISAQHTIGVFEAGISAKYDMEKLYFMLQPTIGILTKLGAAHNSGFSSMTEKIEEKLSLFKTASAIIYHLDDVNKYNLDITTYFSKHQQSIKHISISYVNKEAYCYVKSQVHLNNKIVFQLIFEQQEMVSFDFLYTDDHSIYNGLLVINLLHYLQYSPSKIQHELHLLQAIYLVSLNSQTIMGNGFEKKKLHSSVLEINTLKLKNNFNKILQHVPENINIMAVLKASAYGIGSIELAQIIENFTRVTYLAVAYIDEAIALKQAGCLKSIMLMNVEEQHFNAIVYFHLEPEIHQLDLFIKFVKFLQSQNLYDYPIHIKCNTGMNRLGFNLADIKELIEPLKTYQQQIKIISLFSHLIDGTNLKLNFRQQQILNECCELVKLHLNYTFKIHLASSSAMLDNDNLHGDMIRIGIAMFGLVENHIGLEQPLSLYTGIAQIHELQKGDYIGYGSENKLEKATVIAVVKIGYADGYHRCLGHGKSQMAINGYKVATIGNICMDLCFLDISDIPRPQLNERVEVFGPHISIEQLAQDAGTIPYEILTSIGTRINRIFINE